MPFIAIPNTAMVEIRGSIASEQYENTIYCHFSEGVTVAGMTDLALAIATWVSTDFVDQVHTGMEITEIFVTDMTTGTAPTVSFTDDPLPIDGAAAGTPLTNQDTICVSLRTAGRGRSSRGRVYYGGLVAEQRDTANTISSATAAAVQGIWSNLGDVIEGAGASWVVASRFTEGAARPFGVIAPVTNVLVVDRVIDCRRRRMPGRGV
jgi:hypothetical protein